MNKLLYNFICNRKDGRASCCFLMSEVGIRSRGFLAYLLFFEAPPKWSGQLSPGNKRCFRRLASKAKQKTKREGSVVSGCCCGFGDVVFQVVQEITYFASHTWLSGFGENDDEDLKLRK